MVGFDCLKETYDGDEDFGEIWLKCTRKEAIEYFTSLTVFYLGDVNYAFLNCLCENILFENSMVVVLVDIWGKARLSLWLGRDFTGHNLKEMLKNLFKDAQFVKLLKEKARTPVYIHHFQFWRIFGKIYLWNLSLDFLGLKEVQTLFLLLSIDFPR